MVTSLHSYYHTTWLKRWGTGSLAESKWCHYVMVEADIHPKLFVASIWNIYKVFQQFLMLAIDIRHQPLNQSSMAHILEYWVTRGVKMMSLRHGWGWQPSQSIYCIHMKHIQSVWAHWYAVHWCTVKALHSYNHTTWLRFWGTGLLVESKWCHYVIVKADSQLKLFIASIWDIYK